jgi:hypothetical protein
LYRKPFNSFGLMPSRPRSSPKCELRGGPTLHTREDVDLCFGVTSTCTSMTHRRVDDEGEADSLVGLYESPTCRVSGGVAVLSLPAPSVQAPTSRFAAALIAGASR